jgi:hypothetical protein
MKVCQSLAARLIAPLHDEREAETRPLEEIEEDLRCLGIDPSSSIAEAQRLTFEQLPPTASLHGLEHVSGRHDPAPARRARASEDWLSPATVVGLLRLSDVAVVLAAAWLAWITRFNGVEPLIEPYLAVLAVILTLNVFQFADLYRFDQLTNLFSQLRQLLLAWATVIAGLLVIGFMLNVTSLTLPLNFERSVIHATSRIWVGLCFSTVYSACSWFVCSLIGRSPDGRQPDV